MLTARPCDDEESCCCGVSREEEGETCGLMSAARTGVRRADQVERSVARGAVVAVTAAGVCVVTWPPVGGPVAGVFNNAAPDKVDEDDGKGGSQGAPRQARSSTTTRRPMKIRPYDESRRARGCTTDSDDTIMLCRPTSCAASDRVTDEESCTGGRGWEAVPAEEEADG